MRPILAAVLICALAPAAEAKCARWGLKADVLTPTGAAIAADGGILVGAVEASDAALDSGDTASQPGWRLRIGSAVATPTQVPLAPGLVLYRLPANATEGRLIDDHRATVGTVTVGPKTATLGAPKLKRIGRDARGGRRPSSRITVELAAPAPIGAVILVLADAKGKPRSWGKLTATGEIKILAFDQGRCRVLPNGTVESKPGERVTAFFVDASGRKSPLSAAVAVTSDRVDDVDE